MRRPAVAFLFGMGRLRGVSRCSESPVSPDDALAQSLGGLKLQEVTNTPLPRRSETAKKIPVSARTPGLDGDAWQRIEERDASPSVLLSEDDDTSWLVEDDGLPIDLVSSPVLTPPRPEVIDLVSSPESDSTPRVDLVSSPESDSTTPRNDDVDLSAPTPRKVALAFAKTRDLALAATFRSLDDDVFRGQLRPVDVVWSNRLRTTAGLTRMRRETTAGGVKRTAKIELSTKVIDNHQKLESTLVHELCHAAAWIIDHKSRPPHGPHFLKWAATVHRLRPDLKVTTRHTYAINFAFQWNCTNSACSYVVKRHSNSINVSKVICPRCASKLPRVDP